MFSGITNQFTSLVAAAKGGQADEDVPAPAADVSAAPAAAPEMPATLMEHQDPNALPGEQPVDGEEGAKRSSDSFVDSFVAEATGWLGSAKGWLGSASIPSMPAMPTMAMPSMPTMPTMPSIPSIPGLRKGGAEVGEGGEIVPGEGQGMDPAGVVSGDDEDKSRYISATEGADSHPASGGGTPTGDEGQIGQGKKRIQGEEVKITTKVTQQAKHFGSFLSSAINKAGAKIKETVKDNTILDSFNKEQEAFIKGQGGSDSGAAPWIGLSNEAKIKEEILGLSQDRRNFVRAPPAGVDFEFNYDTAYPTAIAIMAEDKALETMRFELVPKIITEENFWRNYFYRVSLIIQAAELGTLGVDGVGQASSEDDLNTKNSETYLKPVTAIGVSNEASSGNGLKTPRTQTVALSSEPKSSKKLRAHPADSEFVSDAFQTANETDLAEIKDGMRRLGIDSMTQQALEEQKDEEDNEEQWEKDLEAELKDYEVVSDAGGSRIGSGRKTKEDGDDEDNNLPTISNLRTRSTNNDWEEYADLIEDTDDLKTLKSLKRSMLGYQRRQDFFELF